MPSKEGAAAAAGNRVLLRPFSRDDPEAIERWYEEAARAAFEGRRLEELQSEASGETAWLLAVERENEDNPIGLLEYDVRDGWLRVPFIALAKPYRGWGYGSEAVCLLEEWAVCSKIAGRFQAEIHVRNGLGLYFWLRLGYRPAGGDEFNWQWSETRDKMPMVRVAN